MKYSVKKAEFKGALAGTAIDFGFIENKKDFFDFLVENRFLEYVHFVEQKNGRPFHVYMALKDFNYSSRWIQDLNQISEHKVGAGGSMLVSEDYRAIGYKSQVDIYGR